MKKVLVVICLLALSPAFGQVQERFKKTEESTPATQETENRENPSTNKSTATPATTTQNTKEDFWDKIIIGGGVSATFGSYTSLYLAPSIGYRLSDKWVAGGGYTYMYFRSNLYYAGGGNYKYGDTYENTIHGPNVFVNFFPFNGFYAGLQYEILNHDVPYYSGGTSPVYELQNEWTSVFWVQGGISQKLGNKGYVQLGLKYNVLHDYDSPYGTAWFPVIGFMF